MHTDCVCLYVCVYISIYVYICINTYLVQDIHKCVCIDLSIRLFINLSSYPSIYVSIDSINRVCICTICPCGLLVCEDTSIHHTTPSSVHTCMRAHANLPSRSQRNCPAVPASRLHGSAGVAVGDVQHRRGVGGSPTEKVGASKLIPSAGVMQNCTAAKLHRCANMCIYVYVYV